MVATMRDLQVAIATGTAKTNPAKLSVEKWVLIINHAASRLTMDYLHGLKTLYEVMKTEHNGRERLWDPHQQGFNITPGGAKGIVCATLKSLPLPRFHWPSQWESCPPVYEPVIEELVYLERTRDGFKFFLVVSKWVLVSTPESTWLRGEAASVKEIPLTELLERDPEGISRQILFSLHRAQQETTQRLQMRLDGSRERECELKHTIHALGLTKLKEI